MPAPITQLLGRAERSLQAVLARELAASDLSFPQWTALVLLHAEPLSRDGLLDRQRGGHVTGGAEALAELQARGLVGPSRAKAQPLELTPHGREVFEPLRDRVALIAAELQAELPAEDVEATRAILETIAARADARLAA